MARSSPGDSISERTVGAECGVAEQKLAEKKKRMVEWYYAGFLKIGNGLEKKKIERREKDEESEIVPRVRSGWNNRGLTFNPRW